MITREYFYSGYIHPNKDCRFHGTARKKSFFSDSDEVYEEVILNITEQLKVLRSGVTILTFNRI